MWWSAVVEVQSLSGMKKYTIFLPTEQVSHGGRGTVACEGQPHSRFNLSFLRPLRPKSLSIHQMCFSNYKILTPYSLFSEVSHSNINEH